MADSDDPRFQNAGHVLLRLARLFLEAGSDSEHVRRKVESLATQAGFSVQLFIGSEHLLLMLGANDAYRTRIGHTLGAMGLDAGRLITLDALVASIADGRQDLISAASALDAIERSRSAYAPWQSTVAMAGTAAALARLFGAAWPVVGAAFIAGLVNMVMRHSLASTRMTPVAVAALAAASSSALVAFPLHAYGLNPALAMVATGMILVPGVPLLNGLRDIITGHAVLGIARLANALVTVMAIASGLAATSVVVGISLPDAMQLGTVSIPWDFFFSGVAAFGFAILFNAPRKAILAIVVCGALSHGIRSACLEVGSDPALATFTGALLASVIAANVAQRMSASWTAFAFPGVVAMVPGSYAFRGMIGALDVMRAGPGATPALLGATAASLVQSFVVTAAIAAGLLVADAIRAAALHTGSRPTLT